MKNVLELERYRRKNCTHQLSYRSYLKALRPGDLFNEAQVLAQELNADPFLPTQIQRAQLVIQELSERVCLHTQAPRPSLPAEFRQAIDELELCSQEL